MSDLKDAVIRCIKCANPDPCPDRENDMLPHEASLRQDPNNAMLQPRQHVDFVSQLPSDIVITTLIPMFMHDDLLDASSPCQYLYVSKIWRYLIIQSLDGLRFGVNDEDEYNMHTISQLVQFAPYIKSLIMPMLSDRWMAHILYTSNLCSLREITIHGFENRNMKYFIPALKSITTLTHLNITSDQVSFADILLNCPNLISLTMVHHRIDFRFSSIPAFSKLTALHISHEPLPMACHQVIDICKYIPSLKKLHLSICKDMQCVLVVPEYYPSMTHLSLLINRSGIHMTYADQRQSYDDQQGIMSLVIRGDNRPYVHCKDIMTLLEQHHTTLAHLEWDIRIDAIDINLYNIQFPGLTSLVVNCDSDQL
ncbi:hypothetical protein K492DRAFT_200284 [Lichtheimia hyalospora FSU 10163]|nr:hypothetical protein K492DRAFT_200284 [Lichtheimia hyalospora FSU 10163]